MKNKISNGMNKSVLLIIIFGAVVALGLIFSAGDPRSDMPVQNVEVRDGIQYVTIEAKGGYYPRESYAQAGIPTKLVVKTDNTYDCSLALVVRDAKFQNILPPSGETEIDIGVPEAGKNLQGTCSMGMYSFSVAFAAQ